jgi:hypothetical protein
MKPFLHLRPLQKRGSFLKSGPVVQLVTPSARGCLSQNYFSFELVLFSLKSWSGSSVGYPECSGVPVAELF